MKAFEGDLGLHCVETNHANLNLCLCFSALISTGTITAVSCELPVVSEAAAARGII